jgi:hypothetical protein
MLLSVVVLPAPFLKEADGLSLSDLEGDPEKNMACPVIGVNLFCFEYHAVPPKYTF